MSNNIKLNYRISGIAELNAKFKEMDKRMKGRLMTEALKTAIEPVHKLAISRAPFKTGRLKRSIKIGSTRTKARYLKGAAVRTGTRRQLKIPPGNKYYYPAALEYGTEDMLPKSFLRSSLADRKGVALKILAREIERLLLTAK